MSGPHRFDGRRGFIAPPGACIMRIDGRPRSSHAKTCRRCAVVAVITINDVKDAAPRDQKILMGRIINRKFASMGWEIGKRDFCPRCVAERTGERHV